MLSLSPAKLLVVLVIALIVLGPEKLPEVARQLGATWRDVRRWRSWLETEVRSSFPDLPPTHEVVQAVRSPLAFLDRLADAQESPHTGDDAALTMREQQAAQSRASGERPSGDVREAGTAGDARQGPVVEGASAQGAPRQIGVRQAGGPREPPVVPDDPSMN
ncbi:MAG: twin-arginine translocase TatA/TatE family subunit [Acidimicrobiales bacterium]|jgi:sec-independent protein translocase protein TatB